jgi:diguanylate cyclase (GGDEF)-like protein
LGASFLLAVNVTLGLAIMCSFLAIGLIDRSQKAAFWWFAACIAAVMSGFAEYSIPPSKFTAVAHFLIYASFSVAMCCLSIGLAVRYSGRIPWIAVAAGFLISVVAYFAVVDMPRASLFRNVGYQAPYTLIALIGLFHVLKGMKATALDRAILAAVAFNAFHFMARPPMVIAFGGNGARPQDYLATEYALASQTLLAIATILLAFALGARLLADVLDSMRSSSEIDSLSGVLSRDCFTARVREALRPAVRGGQPMALVLCDLDRFKSINDTHGHQVGDRVIEAFGRLLVTHGCEDDLVGRIGGEEFCILLKNCDASAARLFAEKLRVAFEAEEIADLRDGSRVATASFGVSDLAVGESFDAAFPRADQALYEAKRAGRNRVRQWRPPERLAEQIR